MILTPNCFSKKQITLKILINQLVILMLLTLLLAPVSLFAFQVPVYQQQHLTDTVPYPKKPTYQQPVPKRFGRASKELIAAEILPWTFDKFVKKADYANISFKTVRHNLNPGSWSWDYDNFQTNQFGHPYHGSYFFNAFRTNGYSFWQSAPAAFAGSYIWESTAENQSPAFNDFINTSFGGVVLGEMTFRLSNKIINNHSTGFKRQTNEMLALLVDPMNGLNRLLDGRWGKVSHNPNDRDSTKIRAEFDLGFRKFNANGTGFFKGRSSGWFGHIRLLYGTPYEDYETPFSNISINAEFGKDDSSKVNVISVYGSLAGWEIKSTEQVQHLAVLSANYDYIHNEAFFYGGQSIKINLLSEFDISDKIKINTTLGAGPVILAAVPDPYLFHGRNYDYGPGFAIDGGGTLSIADKLFYSINYRGGWMGTINGNPSSYFLHAVSSELSYMFIKRVSISAESGYFTLRGTYKNFNNVYKNYPYLRVSTRYTVNL